MKYTTFCGGINSGCRESLKKYNEIYLSIKYTKSVLWTIAERLSYIEYAWCLKVKCVLPCFWGYAVVQSVEALCYKPEDRGFD